MINKTKPIRILALSSLLVFQLSGCATLIAGTAATSITTGLLVAQDRRTTGTIVEDQTIEIKANQAIKNILRPADKANVKVVSYNNHLLLLGQSPNERVRKDIEEAVKNVAKVNSLHNEIKIAAPISMLTKSSDSWITTKIKSEMLVKKDLNPTRVKVLTEDGVVYLMGIINKSEEQRAVEIARHTKGVKRVVKVFEYLPG